MKIILVGPGVSPIPPVGWGAVESLIWDYYENLVKMGIEAIIINNANLNEVVRECNGQRADVIHIMYDDYAHISPYLNCSKIIYTPHYAYITSPEFEKKYKYYYKNIFMPVIENQRHLRVHALSKEIAEIYRSRGFSNRIDVLGNGAREDKFRFTMEPQKSGKSVYVAKIEFRKAQYKYQSIENIDFVGNYFDSPFSVGNSNYLGEWTKPTLYDKLTDYGNLILLSSGEADPLVVKEGLMAGLGIVVSECSSANLDLPRPFITIIPDDRLEDLDYIAEKIKENREISVSMRAEIRQYALAHFSWSSIIKRYLYIL